MRKPTTAAMPKPKIIISSYDDIKNPYYAGGGARAITEVASRLSRVLDITVLTGNYPGAKNFTLNGVRYRRIGPSFIGPKPSQLLFHFLLPFYMLRSDFDLWIENLTPPFSTSCLQLYTQKPVVGLVHMLAGEDMQRKYMLPFRSIEKIGLKTYRYFIAPTEVAIAQLTSLRQRPQTYMIPNGVAQPKPVMKAAPERYILYIGRIEVNQKGLDLLVAAYASLGLSSDVKLIIAGTGVAQEEKKLRGLIRASNLADRIKLVGRVEGRRKWRLIQQSCLVVIPSRLETFGIVALEAMASSKPVACFDIPGLAWMPTSFAVKAQPFNSRALGESMQRILSDEELASRMAASAQQASLRYSWDKITEQYLDVIEHILQTEGAPTKELANEN